MLIFLLLFPLIAETEIIIQNAGIGNIESDDISMIFYAIIENTFDAEVHLSVDATECSENSMSLIGGYMGAIKSKSTKKITLIFPNLYLYNRLGKCSFSITYQYNDIQSEISESISFNTSNSEKCKTADLNPFQKCNPIDCLIKYSSKKNYYNKEYQICQNVPCCDYELVYDPMSNQCKDPYSRIRENDLEMLENNHKECGKVEEYVMFECHNGIFDNNLMQCNCNTGWVTTSCFEDVYRPNLAIYHMCNIQLNSWSTANKHILLTTILVLFIFAVFIALKMLLAICILNWCCFRFKRSKLEPYKYSGYKKSDNPSVEQCVCNEETIGDVKVQYIPIKKCSTFNGICTRADTGLKNVSFVESDTTSDDCSCICNDSQTDVTIAVESDNIELQYTDEITTEDGEDN